MKTDRSFWSVSEIFFISEIQNSKFKIHERSQKGFSFQNSEMSQKGFRKCQISEISGLKSQVTGWFPYFTENVSISYFDTIIPIYIFLLIFLRQFKILGPVSPVYQSRFLTGGRQGHSGAFQKVKIQNFLQPW